MLKYLSLLLFAASAVAQPFPARPGPVIISQPSTGGSSSSGGVDTNAVIALIEQYGAGGGVVSNVTGLTLSLETRYTNDTAYYAYVSASVALTTTASASDTAAVAIKIDESANGSYEYTAHQVAQQGRAATALSYTSELGATVPPGAAFIYDGTVAAGGGVDIPLGSAQIVYFGSGTNGGGGGISSATATNIAAYQAMIATNGLTGGGVSASEVNAIIQTNLTTYNILDYGARTNAHLALQICLDKAGTNNGGGNVCFIPEGDWYITNSSYYPTLSSENLESMLVIIGTNTIVRGVGPSSKIIVDLGVLASRNVFGSGDTIASGGGRVNWQGDRNITFENFTIDSQQNGGDQTQFYGGHTYKFFNVTSRNSGADFIDTESVTTTAIGCYVSNAIGSAFQTKASTSETAHGIIADCWVEDSSSAASAPTIQVLNNVSILCSNTKIGGPKNIYLIGTFAGGQFSFDNCYFYPTNGGQAPVILVGAVGGITDCIFYGNGSTTASNYIYATNCNLQIANSTFYSKDGIWAHDVKTSIVGNRFINGAGSAITMRGNSSTPWGSSIVGNSFAGGSASAFDNAASFVRFEGNTATDRNVLISGGTNNIIANNTMIGTASTRISSANFNEIRDNIMPVNSASVHSILLTGANSNRISGNNLGKLTLNTGCYGNELLGNRIEHYAYIGGAAESMLNTGTRRNNATSTNTWWPESNWDGQYATNIQATNIVGMQASVFPTNAIPLGSASVTNIGFVAWRGKFVLVATNHAAGGWMWQTNGPSGAPVWGAFNPASQP